MHKGRKEIQYVRHFVSLLSFGLFLILALGSTDGDGETSSGTSANKVETKKALTGEQEAFKTWLLQNTAVIEVHFESDWQIWVRLKGEKYTGKDNVEQIAESIARWYCMRTSKDLAVCTVWNYSGKSVYAKGRYHE